MSIIKQTTIECDEAGCLGRITIDKTVVYEARVAARDFGWTFKSERDICPLHSPLL